MAETFFQKKYFCKVYTPLGSFITVLPKVTFSGFRMEIGGGLGQLILTIPRKFDDFDEDYIIAHRNKIEVWCVDFDTGSDGRKIYSGYIPDYNPKMDKTTENVNVLVYGNKTDLDQTLLLNGTTLNFRTDTSDVLVLDDLGTLEPVDPVNVIKKIIDWHQAIKSNYAVTYDSESIPALSGATMAYGFSLPTSAEAIAESMEFLPIGWWSFIGPDNKFQLKPRGTEADHTFVLGRDFEMIDTDKSIQEIENCVVFTNSGATVGIARVYKDSASIAKHGEYWGRLDDGKVRDITTADSKSIPYLTRKAAPVIKTKFRIFDNNIVKGKGRDIESVYPGQICKFRGFNSVTSKTFRDDMQVVAVDYTPGYIDCELEAMQPNIARDVYKMIKDTEYSQPSTAATLTDATYTQ